MRLNSIKSSREQYLENRVRELKDALDLAQQRINDLETAMGVNDDLAPIQTMGFQPLQAKFVAALLRLPSVSNDCALTAMYAENPDRKYDVSPKIADTVACIVRGKLRRLGVDLVSLGGGLGWHLPGPAKARFKRLMASNAALMAGEPSDQRRPAQSLRIDSPQANMGY